MEIKLFEVRDRATFIPVMAIRPISNIMEEEWLLNRSGFGKETPCIYLIMLGGEEAKYDRYQWIGRTMPVAHRFIEENFNTLNTGDVVDVEFILGEVVNKKITQRPADL